MVAMINKLSRAKTGTAAEDPGSNRDAPKTMYFHNGGGRGGQRGSYRGRSSENATKKYLPAAKKLTACGPVRRRALFNGRLFMDSLKLATSPYRFSCIVAGQIPATSHFAGVAVSKPCAISLRPFC